MSTEIAKPQATLADLIGPGRMTVTSLNLADKKAKRTVLAAMQACDGRLTEMIGQRIVVTDYVAHGVEMNGATDSEIIPGNRLVLVDTKGKTYETVGSTFISSFKTICDMEGYPPWPEGFGLTMRTRKKGERSIYWFDVDK